jgi:hypothetical protein
MRINPEHEVAYQELVALVGRYADQMTAVELLAVASNMVGKLIAVQDARSMTSDDAMWIVIANIEIGYQQAIGQQAIGGGAGQIVGHA